jgi:hypothetical protein
VSNYIRDYFEQLVKYKAKRMQQRKGYKSYRQGILSELKITRLDDAFLIGAFDAMIYDMAGAIGQAYMKPQFRKSLLSKILADF